VDGTVKVWDAGKDDPTTIQLSQPDQVIALAWSPDGAKLAAGSRRLGSWIWDLSQAPWPNALAQAYTPWTWAVAWNPDGTRLAAAGTDGLEVWDPVSLARLRHLGPAAEECRATAWSPDGRHIAGAVGNGKFNIWDAATGELFKTFAGPSGFCCSVVWSPDGRRLAAGIGRRICLWDAVSFAQPRVLAGHTDQIRCLAWSPDGACLASASDDSSAKIWEVANGKEINSLFGHASSVYAVAWSPDGKRVVTGSWDFSVKIWDTMTGTEVCSFDKPGGISQMIYAVAWSPDARQIACSDIEGNICILDATPGGMGAAISSVQPAPARNPKYEADMIRSLKLYCAVVEPEATNNADALRRLAWILATYRYPEVRDGRKAVVFAQEASKLVGGRNPGILSILAAACAETGDFTSAIGFQRQAMAMVPNIDLRTEYAAELRLYEAHQPCRDNSW
jgi:hypothetical protein